MKQTIIIIDDKDKFKLSFFSSLSERVYKNIKEIKYIMPHEKILIIFSKESHIEYIESNISKTNLIFKNTDLYYLIPKKLKSNFEKLTNCFTFPLSIKEINTIDKKERTKPIVYKNLELKVNTLINLANNKSINLSDIEKKIMEPLLFNQLIEKNTIKTSILNYKKDVESNSVESHLSRIRNKLEDIKSDMKIFSNEKGIIKI